MCQCMQKDIGTVHVPVLPPSKASLCRWSYSDCGSHLMKRDKQSSDAMWRAGPEVSAAVGVDGRAWLWGFGTNGQLGNGNDDSDRDVPSLLRGKALQGKQVVQARTHWPTHPDLTQLKTALLRRELVICFGSMCRRTWPLPASDAFRQHTDLSIIMHMHCVQPNHQVLPTHAALAPNPGTAALSAVVLQVDFGGQHTLLVVTGDGAGPSNAKDAASTGAGLLPRYDLIPRRMSNNKADESRTTIVMEGPQPTLQAYEAA